MSTSSVQPDLRRHAVGIFYTFRDSCRCRDKLFVENKGCIGLARWLRYRFIRSGLLPLQQSRSVQVRGGIDLDTRQSTSRDNGVSFTERRRPGRQEHVSPALLPLLRGEVAGHPFEQDLGPAYPDQLSAVRGIAFSLFLSGLVMATVIAPFLLLRHH